MQNCSRRQAVAAPATGAASSWHSVAPVIARRCSRRSVQRVNAALAPPPAAAGGAAAGGGLTYKQAGVDIDAGEELVRRIKAMNPSMNTGFSGFVPFGDSYLVSGTDGVGTKLKLAFDLNKHDTVGIDLVAMSVNDVVTSGAQPLFFLDYFACGKLDVDQAEQVVKGIIEGCRQTGCSLLGGETAEMPGFYKAGEYDLAGFAVGAVKQDALIDGKSIRAGDKILALPSSGVHSNGFSLVRKVLEVSNTGLHDACPWDGSKTIGLALLEPTTIYVKKVVALHAAVGLKGLVHITGGGMSENIPRVIPKGLGAAINPASYKVPELFQWLQAAGGVPLDDMRRTFNMGVGMIMVVSPDKVAAVQAHAPDAWVLGEVVEGEGVRYV